MALSSCLLPVINDLRAFPVLNVVSTCLTIVSTAKICGPLTTLCVCVAGKEYVGIVRLHNAIESEHTLARVSVTIHVAEAAANW